MSESLLGVPEFAGLGTALQGSTSPYDALAFGIEAARGSNDEPFEVEEEMKADEARLPPIRRGALNIVPVDILSPREVLGASKGI